APATVTISPVSLYETTQRPFTLTIDNDNIGAQAITAVDITTPNMTIDAVRPLSGWSENHTTTTIRWSDGVVAEGALQRLYYNASAAIVTADQTITIPVIATTAGGTQNTDVQITILNDPSTPSVTSNFPQDGSYIREGKTDQRQGDAQSKVRRR
ncbi:MAG: hypothetical protein AABY13_01025, partial [Nanoarchaeota archaeon]